jgi:phytoene dehydrogenase-like protein
VQTAVATSWSRWASAGSRYQDEKQRVLDLVIDRIAHRLPSIRGAVTMTDISTPLTYWRYTRAWQGAYEGWYPTAEHAREHPAKTIGHLRGLHLAGQWVEPGGGVPTALWSGRQVIQLLCNEAGHRFVAA